jgi:L-malate glycosyltransferase
MQTSRQKKIKVMFIIDYLKGIAGTENQLLKMISKLGLKDFELHLVCLLDSSWLSENYSAWDCSVKALHYDMFNHKKPTNLIAAVQLVRHIRSIKPDVVMTFFKTSYILGVLAARVAGVKSIISTRRDFGLWIDKGSILLIKFANRFVKRIVTNSALVKNLVVKAERFHSDKIDVIYNGIPLGVKTDSPWDSNGLRKELGIPDDAKVVGIVAGLKPMKRHNIFLQAARNVLHRRKDVHFVIVGSGPRRVSLEKINRDIGIRKHVHFVGHQHDVGPYLNLFDIGVNCSANEGLSNAIMEYMLYGVPCIVSEAGGNTELIENGINGITFPLDDFKTLAEKILLLLQDKELQDAFSKYAKKRIVEDLSEEKMIESYRNYFKNIVAY